MPRSLLPVIRGKSFVEKLQTRHLGELSLSAAAVRSLAGNRGYFSVGAGRLSGSRQRSPKVHRANVVGPVNDIVPVEIGRSDKSFWRPMGLPRIRLWQQPHALHSPMSTNTVQASSERGVYYLVRSACGSQCCR